MNRRQFFETVAGAALVPTLGRQVPASEWGSPVFDLHFHLRPQAASNVAHLDGAGITKANLLTRGDVVDEVKALEARAPGPLYRVPAPGIRLRSDSQRSDCHPRTEVVPGRAAAYLA